MPRTWQYSRWRRLALQAAMCLLLGLSMAAAAWVGQKRRPPAVVLGEVRQHGILRYALPSGWDVEIKGLPSEVVAEEPGPHGRVLRVLVDRKYGRRTDDAEGVIARRSGGAQTSLPV